MEWYHVWWPWLTSKRVVRFVSDSWVSCVNISWVILALFCWQNICWWTHNFRGSDSETEHRDAQHNANCCTYTIAVFWLCDSGTGHLSTGRKTSTRRVNMRLRGRKMRTDGERTVQEWSLVIRVRCHKQVSLRGLIMFFHVYPPLHILLCIYYVCGMVMLWTHSKQVTGSFLVHNRFIPTFM